MGPTEHGITSRTLHKSIVNNDILIFHLIDCDMNDQIIVVLSFV